MKKVKMNFRLMLPFFAAVLLLLVISVDSQAASKKKALNAYKSFLSQPSVHVGYVDDYVDADDITFALAYIDKNNVPELIICYEGGGWGAVGDGVMYTYKGGKIKPVTMLGYAHKLQYRKKKGAFISFSPNDMGGNPYKSYCKLSNGKVKRVSKSAVTKLVTKKKKKTLTFYANTLANRTRYLK